MNWKILASDGLDSEAQEILNKHEWATLVVKKGMSEAELFEELAETDFLIIRSATSVGEAELAKAPKLKGVIRAGVGVDNIDRKATEAQGVWMWNAPTGNFQAAAEHALALMFAAARKIAPAATASAKGEWSKKQFAPFGRQLSEATLGLVGAGNIGSRVGKMCLGLGMRVLVSDPVFEPDEAHPFEKVDLDSLLGSSDFISIHCPLLPSTKHLINREAFLKMKPTAFLINAARGGIVDEQALLEALEAKQIEAAAFDVFESEPFEGDIYKRLLSNDRMLATPHLGASTKEAQRKVGLECAFIIEQAYAAAIQGNVSTLPRPLNGPERPRLSIS